jgi:hypothetical protein
MKFHTIFKNSCLKTVMDGAMKKSIQNNFGICEMTNPTNCPSSFALPPQVYQLLLQSVPTPPDFSFWIVSATGVWNLKILCDPDTLQLKPSTFHCQNPLTFKVSTYSAAKGPKTTEYMWKETIFCSSAHNNFAVHSTIVIRADVSTVWRLSLPMHYWHFLEETLPSCVNECSALRRVLRSLSL